MNGTAHGYETHEEELRLTVMTCGDKKVLTQDFFYVPIPGHE